MRNAVIVTLALLVGACMRVGHIQQTTPIRVLYFTGSPKAMAQCVRQRVGGKVQEDSLGDRYVIYDSVKEKQNEGLTHYAITIGKTEAGKGFAEWRILTPPRQAGPSAPPPPRLTPAAVREFWTPVQDCAAATAG